MQKMKKKMARILSLILMISMLMSNGTMAFATEITDSTVNGTVSVESSSESMDIGETTNRTSETEDAAGSEEESSQKQENPVGSEKSEALEDGKSIEQIETTEEVNTDETVSEDTEEQLGTSIEENQQERAEDEFFYRVLDAEEVEEKEQLSVDTTVVANAKEGEDFVKNEVIYLCDTKEEAEKATKAYAEATGYTVKIKSFSYGVAVFSISGSPKKNDGYASANSVQRVMNYAADMTNNLPAVYPNYIRQAHAVNTSNEKSFSDPFLKTDSEMFQWYHEMIHDKPVYEGQTGAPTQNQISKITVAVLDTGIDSTHGDFAGVDITKKGTISDGKDLEDKWGHGTNVAGIIASASNDIGGRGVAAGVKIYSIKVLGNDGHGEDASIIAGLNSLLELSDAQRPQVINMSLGGGAFSSSYIGPINSLYEKNVTIVASAGNDYTSKLQYPAGYDHVITVAALNKEYEKAQFSNHGTFVDIAAPGGEVRVNKNAVEEQFLWTTGAKEGIVGDYKEDNEHRRYSGMYGTSQAAPIVSATAALLYAKYPSIRPDEVEARLKATASPVKGNYKIGAGCVNISAALGMDEVVPVPRLLIEGESIVPETALIFDAIPNATIYYTLDGKNPEPEKAVEGPDTSKSVSGTYIYDWDNPLILQGEGSITIKAVALLYGRCSAVSSYSLVYDDSLVNEIIISAENDLANVGIGNKLALLTEIRPSYAKNKNLIWTVDDSSIARVDNNGVVTGLSEGEATIRATAADVSKKYGEYKVYVKPLVKTLSVHTGNIVLNRSETYSLTENGQISVYPSNASREYIYTSAKPSIACIDKDGLITAKSSGTTTITVTAADGSGKKDTVTVEVHTLIESMRITGSNNFDKVAIGKTITPKVIFNEKSGFMPDNISLAWKISSISKGGREIYGSQDIGEIARINASTGVLQVYSETDPCEITITATAKDGSDTSASWKVQSYPITEDFIFVTSYGSPAYPIAYKGNVWDWTYWNMDHYEFFLQVWPYDENSEEAYPGYKTSITMNEYSYKSSNAKVIKFNEKGDFEILAQGTSKITITALDGSNKSVTFNMRGYKPGSTGIESPEPHNVIYPGKSIKFKAVSNDKVYWPVEFFASSNSNGWLYRTSSYIKCSKTKVTGSKMIPWSNKWPQYVTALGYEKDGLYWRREDLDVGLEVYYSAVKEVVLDQKELSLKPEETSQLNPTSEPWYSCQKYYTYTSSNPKVATVDSNGKITAVANGKATITVLAGDGSKKKATCTVTVAKPADSLEVTSKTGVFGVASGKSLQLVAKVDPDAANKNVIYTSRDTNVATVNASGKVTAKNVTSRKFVNINVQTADGARQQAVRIGVYPAVTGINVYDFTDSGKNNPLSEVKLSSSYFNGLQQSCTLTTQVLPYDNTDADKCAFDFLQVTSSNPNIVTATNNYSDVNGNQVTLEAVSPGTANVKLVAMDGSGKSTTIKVTVLSPVTSIDIAPKSNIKVLTPGKSLQLVATTNKDATNKNVTWSVENAPDGVKIDQSGKLTLTATKEKMEENNLYGVTVKAEAQDGSGICKTISIPCQTLLTSKLAITDGNGDEIKTLNLCLGDSPGDNNALIVTSNSPFIGYINAYDAKNNLINTEYTVQSSNITVAKAYDNGSNSIALIAGTKAGTATITVTASDGSNKKASFKVNVVDPVRKIAVKSATDGYYMARGTSLSMKAVTNVNATNKKVKWSLNSAPEGVTIDVNGNLKANVLTTPASSMETVEVVATATDGGGVFGKTTVYICNKAKGIKSDGVTKMSLKEGEVIVSFLPKDNTGTEYSEYLISYTTGAAKVRYKSSPSSGYGTSVIVTPIKKGKVTITATAQDGSKMSMKHTIEIGD